MPGPGVGDDVLRSQRSKEPQMRPRRFRTGASAATVPVCPRSGSRKQPTCSASATTPCAAGPTAGGSRPPPTRPGGWGSTAPCWPGSPRSWPTTRRTSRPVRRRRLGAQPVQRPGHPGRQGHRDGAGRDPGRAAPVRVAAEPGGRRRARPGAGRARRRRRQVHQRLGRDPAAAADRTAAPPRPPHPRSPHASLAPSPSLAGLVGARPRRLRVGQHRRRLRRRRRRRGIRRPRAADRRRSRCSPPPR